MGDGDNHALRDRRRYLEKRGLRGPWQLRPRPTHTRFQFLIAVPAYDEGDSLLGLLEQIRGQDTQLLTQTLVVVCVNQDRSASAAIGESNQRTLACLATNNTVMPYLACVDACSAGLALADKCAGVGTARRLAVDLALPFLAPDALVLHLDADVALAPCYLRRVADHAATAGFAAAVVAFTHQLATDPATQRAIDSYERFLKETAIALSRAGSPYGYPPVGSTMVSTAAAYVAVGGMPTRAAAEDFYFLQALAKYRSVVQIPGPLVFPSARLSDRVYLGTGHRLRAAADGADPETLFYTPEAFDVLSAWLQLGENADDVDLDSLLGRTQQISPLLPDFLAEQRIAQTWHGLQASAPSPAHFRRQFHRWFDALKTMRLLKRLSQRGSGAK